MREYKTTKICPICKRELDRSEFRGYSRVRNGRKDCSSYCKECSHEHYVKRKEKAIEYRKTSDKNIENIICSVCKNILSIDNFSKDPKNITGYTSRCKTCQSKYSKSYYKTPYAKFLAYKRRAKQNKMVFDLSFNDFMEFYQKSCSYCGDSIEYIGIDRIDSSFGYIKGNCTSCCSICNTMKLDMDISTWMNHMNKILQFSNALNIIDSDK